jgi:hypothetical protein
MRGRGELHMMPRTYPVQKGLGEGVFRHVSLLQRKAEPVAAHHFVDVADHSYLGTSTQL